MVQPYMIRNMAYESKEGVLWDKIKEYKYGIFSKQE